LRITLPEYADALTIDNNEFNELYTSYFPKIRQLAVFLAIRTILSPVLESYILLDRMLFLCEKFYTDSGDVKERSLTECMFKPIFEEHLSPRNIVIIANK